MATETSGGGGGGGGDGGGEDDVLRHPTKKWLGPGEGCAGCRFEIGDATFCDVCGAYPAQRVVVAGGE